MSHRHRLIDERPLYWLVYTFAIRGNTIIANTMAKNIKYVRRRIKDWSRSDPAPQALLTLSSIQLIQLAKRVREGIKNDLEAVLAEHGFCVAQGIDIDATLKEYFANNISRFTFGLGAILTPQLTLGFTYGDAKRQYLHLKVSDITKLATSQAADALERILASTSGACQLMDIFQAAKARGQANSFLEDIFKEAA